MQIAVGTTVLINLLGGVALLLWGLRMVRTGITRAYGGKLRRQLGRSLSNRYKAFGVGIGITCLLQSSTATALLASSFAGQGAISIAPTLALLLGADIGTTLVAQALSFDLSLLKPVLLFIGVCLFLSARSERQKHLGRVTLGLGLMLLALQLIVSASTPMRESSVIQFLLTSLGDEPVLALLIGAMLSLLAHSSLATVLLVISLAASQSLPLNVGFVLILGANLGGGLPPLIATLGSAPAVRRPPLGNFLFRLAGVILMLPWLDQVTAYLPLFEAEPARQLVNFHLLFNLGVALLFLPLVSYAGQLITKLVPDREEEEVSLKPRYLDRAALGTPNVALSNALREVLRMGDLLETMVDKSFDALRQKNSAPMKKISQADDLVDEYHEKIKLYVTELSRKSLDQKERRRCNQILSFTTNLEHVGDIVETSLVDLIRKTVDKNIHFSRADMGEIEQLHQATRSNMKLAFSVLMTGNLGDARQLLEQKMAIRENERQAIDAHQRCLQEQLTISPKDSALFLDILRDLKRINSHLASVAYPLLEQAGELRSSRLRQKTDAQPLSEPG
ncbi:MAG: Na/Pi cotransporter family protein [Amphritea sp.]